MAYYIRVFGISNPNINIEELVSKLKTEKLTATFQYDKNEAAENWSIIEVFNSKGNAICEIERNPVLIGELGKEELDEFKEYIKDYKPKSAVKWLNNYFDKIKVIYAFQLLDTAFKDENFEIVRSIKSTIWSKTGGILQADNEGFTNDNGYHILWQFSNNVTGKWNMSVKNIFGLWTNFQMDLGNQTQRKEFWDGKVPRNAKKI